MFSGIVAMHALQTPSRLQEFEPTDAEKTEIGTIKRRFEKKSWNIEKKKLKSLKKKVQTLSDWQKKFFESIGEFQKRTHVYKV